MKKIPVFVCDECIKKIHLKYILKVKMFNSIPFKGFWDSLFKVINTFI